MWIIKNKTKQIQNPTPTPQSKKKQKGSYCNIICKIKYKHMKVERGMN